MVCGAVPDIVWGHPLFALTHSPSWAGEGDREFGPRGSNRHPKISVAAGAAPAANRLRRFRLGTSAPLWAGLIVVSNQARRPVSFSLRSMPPAEMPLSSAPRKSSSDHGLRSLVHAHFIYSSNWTNGT